jgi:hypothetical protein
MWCSRRLEEVKREAVRACPPEARRNVRFRGPETRRNYAKLVLENLDGADLRSLCARFPECDFFVRACGRAGGSCVEAYVPLARPARRAALAAASLWAGAAVLWWLLLIAR